MESSEQLEKFKRKAKRFKGQLVLLTLDIVRLTGEVHDDGEDFYWGVREWGRRCDETDKFFSWWSCCVGFIPLKKYLPEKEYNQLEYMFNMNKGIEE